jgi:hypothetical protein
MIFRLSLSATALLKVIPVFPEGISSNKPGFVQANSKGTDINRKIFLNEENLFFKTKHRNGMCINYSLITKK